MSAKTKNLIELFVTGAFAIMTAVWPAQALSGEKEWWPYGVIGVIALLYWLKEFGKRWARV